MKHFRDYPQCLDNKIVFSSQVYASKRKVKQVWMYGLSTKGGDFRYSFKSEKKRQNGEMERNEN